MPRPLILILMIATLKAGVVACSSGPASHKGRSGITGKLLPQSDDADHPRKKVKDDEETNNGSDSDSSTESRNDSEEDPEKIAPEEFFCENAASFLQQAETTDYSQQLAVLCGPHGPTEDFKQSFSYAYTGDGEPKGKVLEVKSNSMYFTRLRYLFALKTPFNTPTEIFAAKPHDAFAQGTLTADSALYTTINSRVDFPPNTSAVQRIIQTYDLQLAKGAGIYDVRQTESNIYQWDTRDDVAIITEHLLNPESNPYWHDQKVLLLSISPQPKTTFIVGALEFTVKNRFDILRFKQTMDELNIATFKSLGQFLKAKANLAVAAPTPPGPQQN